MARSRRLGQLPPEIISAITQPGLVYVAVRSPLGVAVVDPFAASQDETTNQIMQRLGITVEVGFGPPPAGLLEEAAAAPLSEGLKMAGLLLLGGLGLLFLAGRR